MKIAVVGIGGNATDAEARVATQVGFNYLSPPWRQAVTSPAGRIASADRPLEHLPSGLGS